jgi:hypothetical protein
MSYAHYFSSTINCNRVQSLDYMIRVEVEQGEVKPYKNTNHCREVLSMRLPPTQVGGQVLGNTFIDGAHMVLAGPARGHCVFCSRILKLISSLRLTLPNV